MKVSNIPSKEFKPSVMKMLIKHKRKIEEHSENFNRVSKYKKDPIRAQK